MKVIFKTVLIAALTLPILVCCNKENIPAQKVMLPSELDGEYHDAWNDRTLNLNYGGHEMPGKAVRFQSGEGMDAALILRDIIPGIDSVQLKLNLEKQGKTGFSFSGSYTIDYATIEYVGDISKWNVNLDIKAKLQNALSGTSWLLKPFTEDGLGKTTSSPLWYKWQSGKKFNLDLTGTGFLGIPMSAQDFLETGLKIPIEGGRNIHEMFLFAADRLLFKEDGNIIMEIAKFDEFDNRWWIESPSNMMMYFMRDGKFYLVVNVPTMLAMIPGGPGYEENQENGNTDDENTDGNVPAPEPTPETKKMTFAPIIKGLGEILPEFIRGGEMKWIEKEGNEATLIFRHETMMDVLTLGLLPFIEHPQNRAAIEYNLGVKPVLKPLKPLFLSIMDQIRPVVEETTFVELGLELKKEETYRPVLPLEEQEPNM